MSHRDRNDNRARKDPNKLAKRTKKHVPKTVYSRKTPWGVLFVSDLVSSTEEVDNETPS